MKRSVGLLARMVVSVVLTLASAALAAEEKLEPAKYAIVEDVVYGNKDGLGLTMDVLTPEENAKGIAVVLVSSGGWHSSKSNVSSQNEKRIKSEHWVQGLLKGGYTVFLARHGSSPRYTVPEMVEDIRRGVRYVRTNAARFKVDPDHIGITSGSSGGHLSLMVGLTGDDGKPDAEDPVERASSRTQAIVAWFPPTDLINWGVPEGYKTIEKIRPKMLPEILGKVTDLQEQLKGISPIYHVTSDDPPLLLIHGDRDLTVPVQQSKVLKAKYEETSLPVELVVQPGGGHTYWLGIMNQYPTVWNWFDQYLSPK